jgi:hypothetical protein
MASASHCDGCQMPAAGKYLASWYHGGTTSELCPRCYDAAAARLRQASTTATPAGASTMNALIALFGPLLIALLKEFLEGRRLLTVGVAVPPEDTHHASLAAGSVDALLAKLEAEVAEHGKAQP